MESLRFFVYSDYLCPWCYNASVRLRPLEEEFRGRVRFEWRSFLLRPNPSARRDLERFRAYTQSWLRPAEEEDSGRFQVWQGEDGPPSHSVPPHLVAKAAARLGEDAFGRLHERLLQAYFAENRDISSEAVLRALWDESELPEEAFASHREPALLEQVLDEHNEAHARGVTGVPAMQREGNDAVIVGAHPAPLYRRWLERSLAEYETPAEGAKSREG